MRIPHLTKSRRWLLAMHGWQVYRCPTPPGMHESCKMLSCYLLLCMSTPLQASMQVPLGIKFDHSSKYQAACPVLAALLLLVIHILNIMAHLAYRRAKICRVTVRSSSPCKGSRDTSSSCALSHSGSCAKAEPPVDRRLASAFHLHGAELTCCQHEQASLLLLHLL